jgi:seryl-tRNA synthetase
MLYTLKKRKYAEHFISEILTADVSTPKRARRVIAFIKNINKKKSKIIKNLQERNRKLSKRITSFKELIAYLTKEDMMSKEATKTFMVQ